MSNSTNKLKKRVRTTIETRIKYLNDQAGRHDRLSAAAATARNAMDDLESDAARIQNGIERRQHQTARAVRGRAQELQMLLDDLAGDLAE